MSKVSTRCRSSSPIEIRACPASARSRTRATRVETTHRNPPPPANARTRARDASTNAPTHLRATRCRRAAHVRITFRRSARRTQHDDHSLARARSPTKKYSIVRRRERRRFRVGECARAAADARARAVALVPLVARRGGTPRVTTHDGRTRVDDSHPASRRAAARSGKSPSMGRARDFISRLRKAYHLFL